MTQTPPHTGDYKNGEPGKFTPAMSHHLGVRNFLVLRSSFVAQARAIAHNSAQLHLGRWVRGKAEIARGRRRVSLYPNSEDYSHYGSRYAPAGRRQHLLADKDGSSIPTSSRMGRARVPPTWRGRRKHAGSGREAGGGGATKAGWRRGQIYGVVSGAARKGLPWRMARSRAAAGSA